MGNKWEVSIRQYSKPEYPTLYEEILFITNDLADVQELKDDMDRLSALFRVEVVVRTVEVHDEV